MIGLVLALIAAGAALAADSAAPAASAETAAGAAPGERGGATVTETDPPPAPQVLLLPFPFYNEHFGAALGGVYGIAGWPEPQARVLGTAFAGSRGSAMMFLAGQDLRLPWFQRLFLDPIFSFGYFQENESFVDGNPRFPDQQAGSNQSSRHNYIKGNGFDNFARMRLRYLLPIGDGAAAIIPEYQLDRGLLVGGATGGSSLNPLVSGRSYLSLRPFYRSQQIDTNDIDQNEFKTNGLDVAAFWDNRDWPENPSRGQGVRIEYSQDYGVLNSSGAWTVIEGEIDQYFDLGASDWFRQQVLALDFWTAHSPSWNTSPSGRIYNRPPSYTGATLGGLWRMRGFPSQRFSDDSAVYYSAELRMIPDWNPFEDWPMVQQFVGVDWLQVVPFVEVGRVAPSYDLRNLHSSMQWSGGLGLRALAKGFVIRMDTAGSTEGFGVQMMVSQPFQF